MTEYGLLFTDFPITKESILEETKNDPELAKYFDCIKGGNLHVIECSLFDDVFNDMHDIVPNYITEFYAVTHLNRTMEGIYRERAVNVRLWLYQYIKKILKRSRVWYASVIIGMVPVNSNELHIIDVDINKLISDYDRNDDMRDDRNIYYRFYDSEAKKQIEQF